MRSRNARVQQLTMVAWFRAWFGSWRFWFVVAVAIAAAVVVPEGWKLFSALASFFLLFRWSQHGLTVTKQDVNDVTDALLRGAQIRLILRVGATGDVRDNDFRGWHAVKLRLIDGGFAWRSSWGPGRPWHSVATAGATVSPFVPNYPRLAEGAPRGGINIVAGLTDYELVVGEPAAAALLNIFEQAGAVVLTRKPVRTEPKGGMPRAVAWILVVGFIALTIWTVYPFIWG